MMTQRFGLLIGLLISGVITACGSRQEGAVVHKPSGKLWYDIAQPSQKFFMPDDLEEISGIAAYQPGQLACVQDEEGKVYIYDLEQKRVVRRIRFGSSGDYEDIAIVDQTIYIVKSNGSLYHFPISDEKKVEALETETPLRSENDVEGLCFDSETKMLWMACKGQAGIGEDTLEGKAVYAYDPANATLSTTPVFSIDVEKIQQQAGEQQNRKARRFFQPSAIAVNPVDKRIYMVAANGNRLVVLDRNGALYETVSLPPKVFRQPEGICFTANGDMFISSEGDGQPGYILRFEYLKK